MIPEKNNLDLLYEKGKMLLDRNLNSIAMRHDRKFEYTEHNIPIINAMLYYFVRDSDKFIELTSRKDFSQIFINGTSLKKGLLLVGGLGTGKTTIVTAFQRCKFPGMEFKSKTCPAVISGFNEKEYAYLIKGNWYFDELGREGSSIFSKKDAIPIMSKIIYERYHDNTFGPEGKTGFTILTSNYPVKELKATYGDYIGDRMLDMFNIIRCIGPSFRK